MDYLDQELGTVVVDIYRVNVSDPLIVLNALVNDAVDELRVSRFAAEHQEVGVAGANPSVENVERDDDGANGIEIIQITSVLRT